MTPRYNTPRMRNALAAAGWTRSDLAREVQMTPKTVGAVLDGKTARPPTVRLIAEALGLEIADLVIPEPDLPAETASPENKQSATPEITAPG